MNKSYEFILRCHRDSIDFINKIIEAYEGLGTVRTISPHEAIISIITTLDFIDDLRIIIADLQENHLEIEIIKEEEWSGSLY